MKVMDKKVGFIGAGNMASALISGMISAGFKPENIFASSPGKDHLDLLSNKFSVKTSNAVSYTHLTLPTIYSV